MSIESCMNLKKSSFKKTGFMGSVDVHINNFSAHETFSVILKVLNPKR